MLRRAALALALLVLGAFASPASAHDPAEQPLRTGTAFIPFPIDSAQAVRFLAVLASANRKGFTIRVAVIARAPDLDEYTAYWQKPRAYARLLGGELRSTYKQRLLVVMPNGFGFNWPRHSVTAEYATLREIPVDGGHDGLLAAAQTAVQRLAAATGVHVSAPARVTTPAQRAAHDRLVIILALLAVAAVAVVLSALRRTRSRTSRRNPRR